MGIAGIRDLDWCSSGGKHLFIILLQFTTMLVNNIYANSLLTFFSFSFYYFSLCLICSNPCPPYALWCTTFSPIIFTHVSFPYINTICWYKTTYDTHQPTKVSPGWNGVCPLDILTLCTVNLKLYINSLWIDIEIKRLKFYTSNC